MISSENMDSILLSEQRIFIYSILSGIYRVEAGEAMIRAIENIGEDSEAGDILSEGFRMLKASISNRNSGTLLNLARDYARIFLGAGLARGEAAYPYESVYLSEKHIMMQDSRDEILELFWSEHLGKDDSLTFPEDHICLEFEFMAFLTGKEKEATEKGDDETAAKYREKQEQFFRDHLGKWVFNLCAAVDRVAKEDFYIAVSKLTSDFMRFEKELLIHDAQ